MKSVMVFNFRTMKFEQATEAEGKEWLSLIEANNAECAAQQPRAVDLPNESRQPSWCDDGLDDAVIGSLP